MGAGTLSRNHLYSNPLMSPCNLIGRLERLACTPFGSCRSRSLLASRLRDNPASSRGQEWACGRAQVVARDRPGFSTAGEHRASTARLDRYRPRCCRHRRASRYCPGYSGWCEPWCSPRPSAHVPGTAYATANQVPNLVYELVLGGALTSAMVPVLARSAERSATDPGGKGPCQPDQLRRVLTLCRCWILVPLDPHHHRGGRASRLLAQPGQPECALHPFGQ